MFEEEIESEEKEYNSNQLNFMRELIEQMPKFHQIAILRLLSDDKTITINENKSGIYINMSELPSYKIKELEKYVNYVKTQEDTLNDIEKQKETYKNTFFQKDNKDNLTIIN
uniref:NET domain-containing protein n=1 Tax=viral metagenome TaxID=1070528 RepID=A0A6C0IS13_9ZZZZ